MNEAAKLRAILSNIDRYFQRLDLSTIQRRVDGWTDDGHSGGGDGVGRSSSGAGEHSDPTFAKAAAPREPNYRQILRDTIRQMERAEWALGELSRPTRAVTEEQQTAHTAPPAPSMAGACEACGRSCSGDKATDDVVIRTSGAALCRTHNRGLQSRRRTTPWLTTEDYVASIRSQRGLDLEAS